VGTIDGARYRLKYSFREGGSHIGKPSGVLVMLIGLLVLTTGSVFADGRKESPALSTSTGPVAVTVWDINTEHFQQTITVSI
jgi:hypothetical protein